MLFNKVADGTKPDLNIGEWNSFFRLDETGQIYNPVQRCFVGADFCWEKNIGNETWNG